MLGRRGSFVFVGYFSLSSFVEKGVHIYIYIFMIIQCYGIWEGLLVCLSVCQIEWSLWFPAWFKLDMLLVYGNEDGWFSVFTTTLTRTLTQTHTHPNQLSYSWGCGDLGWFSQCNLWSLPSHYWKFGLCVHLHSKWGRVFVWIGWSMHMLDLRRIKLASTLWCFISVPACTNNLQYAW